MQEPYVLHDIMKQFASQGCESNNPNTSAEEDCGKEEKQEGTVEDDQVQPPADVLHTPPQ